MDTHKKQISDEEIQIIQILDSLSLLECTLIQSIEGNTLTEKNGVHISRTQWDIKQLYGDVMAPFRGIKSDIFSPGFYCYMNTLKEFKEKDYRLYLLKEIGDALNYSVNGNSSEVKYLIFREIEQAVRELIQKGIEINQFHLLHGDLYNGNILMNEGKYALIDFEYVRFGPSQLEWAFVLFWDLMTEQNLEKRVRIKQKVFDELDILEKEKILSNTDIMLIQKLFLPAIICLALHHCDMSKFAENDIIRIGLLKFWNDENKFFMERLKWMK